MGYRFESCPGYSFTLANSERHASSLSRRATCTSLIATYPPCAKEFVAKSVSVWSSRFPGSVYDLGFRINKKIKTFNRQQYGLRDGEFFTLKLDQLHETKYALAG